MTYSIELYFDRRFEEKLRSLWDELEKAGLPSVFSKMGSRPHLTLIILDRCDEDHVAGLIDRHVKRHFKFSIAFPAFSIIPGVRNSVFLTPVIKPELIDIQRKIANLLEENGYAIQKHYEPHNWLPHCSISKGLSPAEALKTLEVCLYHGIKGETWVTDIGFIKFRPRKVIKTIGMADKND